MDTLPCLCKPDSRTAGQAPRLPQLQDKMIASAQFTPPMPVAPPTAPHRRRSTGALAQLRTSS
jgi:hypothetical protein